MKMAKLYITKKDFAEKFGIKEEDFIIANVTSDYYSVEFDLIFSNDVESGTIHLSDTTDRLQVRRQKL